MLHLLSGNYTCWVFIDAVRSCFFRFCYQGFTLLNGLNALRIDVGTLQIGRFNLRNQVCAVRISFFTLISRIFAMHKTTFALLPAPDTGVTLQKLIACLT